MIVGSTQPKSTSGPVLKQGAEFSYTVPQVKILHYEMTFHQFNIKYHDPNNFMNIQGFKGTFYFLTLSTKQLLRRFQIGLLSNNQPTVTWAESKVGSLAATYGFRYGSHVCLVKTITYRLQLHSLVLGSFLNIYFERERERERREHVNIGL